jgi:hypothetical protein
VGYFVRLNNESMQEAIEAHNYKAGYQSVEHAESQIEPGDSYQIYRDMHDGIDIDEENQFETVNGREFQLIKSGVK